MTVDKTAIHIVHFDTKEPWAVVNIFDELYRYRDKDSERRVPLDLATVRTVPFWVDVSGQTHKSTDMTIIQRRLPDATLE